MNNTEIMIDSVEVFNTDSQEVNNSLTDVLDNDIAKENSQADSITAEVSENKITDKIDMTKDVDKILQYIDETKTVRKTNKEVVKRMFILYFKENKTIKEIEKITKSKSVKYYLQKIDKEMSNDTQK